jgi:hypothetical protein
VTEVFVLRACPDLRKTSESTELLNELIAPCRYDQWELPGNRSGPLHVGVRMHVYFLGAIEAQSLVSDVTVKMLTVVWAVTTWLPTFRRNMSPQSSG